MDSESKISWPSIGGGTYTRVIKLKPQLKSFRGINPKTIVVPSHYQSRLVSIITDGIPIHVIYNGIDTSFYRALSPEEINFDRDPIIPNGKKIIGWIGRLDKRKNWQMLIEVAKLMKSQRDDIEFWVIGGAQSVQREEFIAKWQEEKLTDIVKWFPVIPYQHMPHVYAKIRLSGGCTLATTKTESFGNTFIESMVCGVPVVASKMMPVTELVVHEEHGLLYRGQNVEDAVHQINRIVDNPSLHQQMSEAAIARVHEKFAIEVVAEQYVHLLQKIVGNVSAKDSGVEEL